MYKCSERSDTIVQRIDDDDEDHQTSSARLGSIA